MAGVAQRRKKTDMEITRVVVIGGGTMGNGIAQVFAQAGYRVRMVDVSEAALAGAIEAISSNLGRLIKKGILDEADRAALVERIETETDAARGVRDADLVVEAVPEQPELKYELFSMLGEEAPEHALLASNTSSISITEIAARSSCPDRVIGMHFMNPVPVMQLVEVIRGPGTSDETVATATGIVHSLGKTPVEVNDSPGFVTNRVLMPMINEAAYALLEGVAEAEAIDTVMKLGMNHPMGPLELADLIGLDTCVNILEVLHRDLGDDRYVPCPLLAEFVASGWLGRKSGRGFYQYSG